MEDLLHLHSCRPQAGLQPELSRIESPLRWKEWDAQLTTYPDQRLRAYIVDGIRYGFRVGYNYEAVRRPSKGNMKSALVNPQVIQDYLHTELTDAAHGITTYGRGALMIKVDIRNAYRVVPIHSADRQLGYDMGRSNIRQHGPPIWSVIDPYDIYCNCRCSGMESKATRGRVHHALS